jgi:diguanylate cyclase (GGDEF)-like protein
MADIVNFLPDATFVINLEGEVIAWNKAAEAMTGVKAKQIIGQGDFAYSVLFYGTKKPMLIDLVLNPNAEIEKQYLNFSRDADTLKGQAFAPALRNSGAYLSATASVLYDDQGAIVGAIESIRDITEQKRVEEQTRYICQHDQLTGLYNRARFEEELQKYENSQYVPIGIIMCDVDGLKIVNDTFGHKTGDELLLSAARVIKKAFREGDMVARVGSDEISVLLPLADIFRLEEAVLCIQNEVENYNRYNVEIPLSISIGFAFRKNEAISLHELYKRADNHMYREKLRRSQSARSAIVKTLIKTMEARDLRTEEHAERMQKLLTDLAIAINLPAVRLNDLLLSAQFHDIGKVGIPDRILFKTSSLTEEETIEMQRHCEIGHRIALAAPELAPIADWILKHHEWWNGQGYPLGLKAMEIPIECRMLSIVDAYDAMTSDRPYRKALSPAEAIAQLINGSNTQFDPNLVAKFVDIADKNYL